MATVIDGTTGVTQLKGAGTTTNDNAAAGQVGEYVESVVLVGAAISLTSAAPTNLGLLNLTAGDWDVSVSAVFVASMTTGVLNVVDSPNTVSATHNSTLINRAQFMLPAPSGLSNSVAKGNIRFSLAAPTVIYHVVEAVFTGTCTAYGRISARRVR